MLVWCSIFSSAERDFKWPFHQRTKTLCCPLSFLRYTARILLRAAAPLNLKWWCCINCFPPQGGKHHLSHHHKLKWREVKTYFIIVFKTFLKSSHSCQQPSQKLHFTPACQDVKCLWHVMWNNLWLISCVRCVCNRNSVYSPYDQKYECIINMQYGHHQPKYLSYKYILLLYNVVFLHLCLCHLSMSW